MKTHILKVEAKNWSKYEQMVSFSVRLNDRDYQPGDLCVFEKIFSHPQDKWEIRIVKQIEDIHGGYGMGENFVVLTLKLIGIVKDYHENRRKMWSKQK